MKVLKKNRANKVPKVVPGTIIEITERTCSEKLQKNIKVGNRFIVTAVTELKNGTPAVEIKSPYMPGKEMRVNAERFRWRAVTLDEIKQREEVLRVQADGRAKNAMLKQKFSDWEIDHILFTPYVYELLTWYFVDKCHKYAADNKIDFCKVSRLAVESRRETDKEAAFELGEKVYSQFVYGVKVMTEEFTAELTRIWWQVNSEIKRLFPDMKYVDLRTFAVCGLLSLRLLDNRENSSDEMINKRLGGSLVYAHRARRSPILHKILEGYAGDAVGVDYEKLNLCSMVMKNNIECIKFTTLHNEFRKNY